MNLTGKHGMSILSGIKNIMKKNTGADIILHTAVHWDEYTPLR